MQVINIPQVPTPPMPPELIFQQGPPEKLIIGIVVIVGFIVAGVILGPLIKALARRIEGNVEGSPEIEARLHDLEARLAAGEQERAELVERLDFTERIVLETKDRLKELPR